MANLIVQLNGYRLTTAHILYHLPDHPLLLQSYIWQDYDLAPQFPILGKFLEFWTTKLEGKLHSVTVGHREILTPSDPRFFDVELALH